VFVFDTSVFINGWNDHYQPPAFDELWAFVGTAMEEGRVIAPREVRREIERHTDALATWAKGCYFVDPSPEVQAVVGQIQESYRDQFDRPGRNDADPWVIAHAKETGFCVVTYEGREFSGRRAALRPRNPKMPDICAAVGVDCVNPSTALNRLGVRVTLNRPL